MMFLFDWVIFRFPPFIFRGVPGVPVQLLITNCFLLEKIQPRKTNMTMENQPFEDVSPVKHGDIPLSC